MAADPSELRSAADETPALPLFPLHQVLFPGARLALQVFEARYLDLVADCLRRQAAFGVVCLTQGGEVREPDAAVRFVATGTLARIDVVQAERAGLLHVACTGTRRFRLRGAATAQANGLWVGPAQLLPDDPAETPPAALRPVVQALAATLDRLQAQGIDPFAAPHRLDDAGWVANRWGELLPLPLRQPLLELDDPLQRLQRVRDHLVERGVIPG